MKPRLINIIICMILIITFAVNVESSKNNNMRKEDDTRWIKIYKHI